MSTQTSMTPSPSHLAIRTPRREQMSRRRARKAVSTSTARSSPSHLRQGREARDIHEGEAAMHPHTENAPMPAAPRPNSRRSPRTGWWRPVGPPTMAPWRRRGDSSRARWCWSAAGPRTSARATALRLAAEGAAVAVGDVRPRGCGVRGRGGGGGRRPRRRRALRRPPRGVGRRLRRARRRRVRRRRRGRPQRGLEPPPSRHGRRRRRSRRVGAGDRDHDAGRPAPGPPRHPGHDGAAAAGPSSPSRRGRAPSASRPGWPTACPRRR